MSSLLLPHDQRAKGPWVKLQSEPSKCLKNFNVIRFNIINKIIFLFNIELFTALMYDLGVRGAQATEVFVLDDTLDFDDLGYMITIRITWSNRSI